MKELTPAEREKDMKKSTPAEQELRRNIEKFLLKDFLYANKLPVYPFNVPFKPETIEEEVGLALRKALIAVYNYPSSDYIEIIRSLIQCLKSWEDEAWTEYVSDYIPKLENAVNVVEVLENQEPPKSLEDCDKITSCYCVYLNMIESTLWYFNEYIDCFTSEEFWTQGGNKEDNL